MMGATSFVKVTDCADAAVARARRNGVSRSAFDIRTSAVRSRGMMRRFEGIRKAENLLFPAIGLAIGALLAGGEYLAARAAGNARAGAGNRPIQVQLDGYRSSDGCRACHPSQYASWHASYHRTMTQLATPQSMATSFDNVVVEAAPGGPMRLEQRGQEL